MDRSKQSCSGFCLVSCSVILLPEAGQCHRLQCGHHTAPIVKKLLSNDHIWSFILNSYVFLPLHTTNAVQFISSGFPALYLQSIRCSCFYAFEYECSDVCFMCVFNVWADRGFGPYLLQPYAGPPPRVPQRNMSRWMQDGISTNRLCFSWGRRDGRGGQIQMKPGRRRCTINPNLIPWTVFSDR